MAGETLFAPDANVFIEASRRYYSFDLALNFWDGIVQYAASGRAIIVDVIKKEIEKKEDELKKWAKDKFRSIAVSSQETDTVKAYREILAWVQAQDQFLDYAKGQFAKVADGWLIAYAKTNSLVIVTHEGWRPQAKKVVPIPNICRAFDVNYCDTFEMMRVLGLTLH